MRSGSCSVQQTLSPESASVLKHSLSLARRRGHAQVSPLHVASTLLMSSRASILKLACIKSQNSSSSHVTPPLHQQNPHITPTSQPLHCRALDLCFNVALNRLPSTPGPLLHGQPSLSNALIAALKRAQAHQRRGCIENQQTQQNTPLLAIRVELEQLILSILDDPSVSRVMREAGFSSTDVKTNLHDYSSTSLTSPRVFFSTSGGGIYSSPSSPNSDHQHLHNHQNPNFLHTHFLDHSPGHNPSLESVHFLKKDVTLIMEVLLGKKSRKNTVIVGDSLSITEGVVIELMRNVERGDVPNELRNVHFIKFQFSSLPLRFMKREEVEMNLADLRRKVESLSSTGGGVIIHAGDLKWTVDERESGGERGVTSYSPVDHLVVEIGKLISHYNVSNKVWLIGTANYQTFMKCKMKKPSLEIQWTLQAVSVPSAGLGLSLNVTTTSGHESKVNLSKNICEEMVDRKLLLSTKEEEDGDMVVMSCCDECNSNYEKEASAAVAATKTSTMLPFWLHPTTHSSTLHKEHLVELRRKWNRLCHSLHQGRHNLNKNYIDSSSLNSNDNQKSIAKSYSYSSSHYPFWPNNSNHIKNNSSISFGDTMKPRNDGGERSYPRFRRQQSCHIDPKVGQQPNLDCLKCRDDDDDKEVKITLGLGNHGNSVSESSKRQDVCKFLQENLPWHSEKMHTLVDSLLPDQATKKDSWILIEGDDSIGKRRLAMAIAKAMFGSSDLLLCINMRDSVKERQLLERTLKDQENAVVMVEDADFGDGHYLKILSDGFEDGQFGENGQVIFILSMGDHHDDDKRSQISPTRMKLVVSEISPIYEVDQKRKPKWDSDEQSKVKVPRIEEDEIKKDLSRQSRSSTLDLNIKVEVQDIDNGNSLEFSPNSSDLTREMGDASPRNPLGFLEMVKGTRLVFDRSSARHNLMRESLLFKMKRVFKVLFDCKELDLKVEEMVLDEVLLGCGVYLNSLFEKWLKEVFQTSLEVVKSGGKGVKSLRVCLVIDEKGGGVGIEEKNEGFMGTNLPNKIKICFIL
ncbi:putative Clp, repeat (R) domain, P-loop containing nucleoside triphosphate hydrolase [Helianthus debilis subsp. tardiflorus]